MPRKSPARPSASFPRNGPSVSGRPITRNGNPYLPSAHATGAGYQYTGNRAALDPIVHQLFHYRRPVALRAIDNIRMVSTFSASNPGFTVPKASEVRIRRADPTSNTTANATSINTNIVRALLWRSPVPDRPPPYFKDAFRSVREACSAGIRPNRIPVAAAARIAGQNAPIDHHQGTFSSNARKVSCIHAKERNTHNAEHRSSHALASEQNASSAVAG